MSALGKKTFTQLHSIKVFPSLRVITFIALQTQPDSPEKLRIVTTGMGTHLPVLGGRSTLTGLASSSHSLVPQTPIIKKGAIAI
jgi:hypothetical protein